MKVIIFWLKCHFWSQCCLTCRDTKRQRQEKEHTQIACCVGSRLRRCLLRAVVWQKALSWPPHWIWQEPSQAEANSPWRNGRKRAGVGSGLGLLVRGCVVLDFSEHSWLETQVISWIAESLSGRSWRLEKLCVFGFCMVGSLKKKKSKNLVTTQDPQHATVSAH